MYDHGYVLKAQRKTDDTTETDIIPENDYNCALNEEPYICAYD